jgi:hypothetical protein
MIHRMLTPHKIQVAEGELLAVALLVGEPLVAVAFAALAWLVLPVLRAPQSLRLMTRQHGFLLLGLDLAGL